MTAIFPPTSRRVSPRFLLQSDSSGSRPTRVGAEVAVLDEDGDHDPSVERRPDGRSGRAAVLIGGSCRHRQQATGGSSAGTAAAAAGN
jgi:hypothetical protein